MVRANNVICNTTYPVYVRFSGGNKAPKVGLDAYHCAANVSFDIALSLGRVEQKRTRIIDVYASDGLQTIGHGRISVSHLDFKPVPA